MSPILVPLVVRGLRRRKGGSWASVKWRVGTYVIIEQNPGFGYRTYVWRVGTYVIIEQDPGFGYRTYVHTLASHGVRCILASPGVTLARSVTSHVCWDAQHLDIMLHGC